MRLNAILLIRKIVQYPTRSWKYVTLFIVASVILSGCGGVGDSYSCSDTRKLAALYRTEQLIDLAERVCPQLRWLGDLESIYLSWNERSYRVAIPYPDHSLDDDGFIDTSDISKFLNQKSKSDLLNIYIDLFGVASLPTNLPKLILSNENIADSHPFKQSLPDNLRANVDVSFYAQEFNYLGGALTYQAGYVMYKPSSPPIGVVILIQGHSNEYLQKELVYLLEKGLAVILRGMPGFLNDYGIFYNGEPFGEHDKFYDLESNDFNPMTIFIGPNVVAVNLALAVYPLSKIYVAGLSGGGLLSLLLHALDGRVSASLSVSGWKPFFLRYRSEIKPFEGDYEQNTERFYYKHRINYLDLVSLSARNGVHTQVWVEHDASSFGGDGHKYYAKQMSGYTQDHFRLIVDSTSLGHEMQLWYLDALFK